MKAWNQVIVATRLAVQSLPKRLGMSSVVMLGMAGTVTVFIAMLGMATSLQRISDAGGRIDRVLMLQTAAGNEVRSNFSADTIATIINAPGIKRGADGKPLASAEVLVVLPAVSRSGRTAGNMVMRGIGAQGLSVRPEIKLIEGRMFQSGLREVIVGQALLARFQGLEIGSRVRDRFSSVDWTVVGVFTSSGDARESELLTDAGDIQAAYKRNQFQSVTAVLDRAHALEPLQSSLKSNPNVAIDVQREADYLRARFEPLAKAISLVGWTVTAIMALGAILAAINAMYLAVSVRSREMATLGAIGFAPWSLVVSVLAESLLLAVAGAVLGGVIALLFLQGSAAIAPGSGDAVPLVYRLSITPSLVILSMALACAVGLVGALMPALRVSRSEVADALRIA